MKIIIVGAGRVGESVARNLASEKNEITIENHEKIEKHRIRL